MSHPTPCQSIHKYCVECMGDNIRLVAKCEREDCALWPFRMGKNPNYKGMGTKKKDAKTGKFLKTERILVDNEITLQGKYKLVKIENEE